MVQLTLPRRLSELQSANGAFRSRMVFRDHEEEDLNGFSTALVLRHLRSASLPAQPGLDEVRGRALDFLERCASSRLPGAFSFWPAEERPVWARDIPEDADDTAVLNQELLMHGRRGLGEVRRVVSEILVPALITEADRPGPPWIHPLVFPTWLGPKAGHRNIVDCCVNVNVAALMSWCGLRHLPGYYEACALVGAGLDWAGDDRDRLRTLTPYYQDPAELCYALEHAVFSGALELQASLTRLQATLSRQIPIPRRGSPRFDRVLCGNAYGGPLWLCSALEAVRECTPN